MGDTGEEEIVSKIMNIKHHRALGQTLCKLSILSKPSFEPVYTSNGTILDTQWGLKVSKEYVERLYDRCMMPEQLNAKKTLLIDDVRNIKATLIARDYWTGIECLTQGYFKVLYIDHDLASYDDEGREFTGYDIMCWLEEYPRYAPREIICVSDNPVGRKRIQTVITNIKRRRNETT